MAMYNNGFPATYQPLYQPYTPVQVPSQNVAPVQQPVQGSLNWIQGEQAAKSYLIAPNSTVVLFDSESEVIYIKSADASGMPSMKILDYTIRDSAKNTPNSLSGVANDNLSNYATKDEIKAISEQIEVLRERLDGITKRKARLTDDE